MSVDGDDAFILADQNLDTKEYNEEAWTEVTWENSTIRSWLNGYGESVNKDKIDFTNYNFINNAFSAAEQVAIKTTNVVNEDNPQYGTDGGNDTEDKVYLLSVSEATNIDYGFNSVYNVGSKTREAKNTKYAERCDAHTYKNSLYYGNGEWYLRTPGFKWDGVITVLPATTSAVATKAPVNHDLNNPTKDSKGASIWDCIYFGNYWQNDTNGDGKADRNDEKQPIKWRVLSVDGDDAFILADQNLDVQAYNETYTDVTWENCTMRSWLNGYGASENKNKIDFTNDNFIDNAFSVAEQAVINTTEVVNEDNPFYGAQGGNDTKDKVYVLAISEVSNMLYGFNSDYRMSSLTRGVKNTEYVKNSGAITSTGGGVYNNNGVYWLRTLDGYNHSCSASIVNAVGVAEYTYDIDLVRVNDKKIGVCPALHINLSDTTLWSYAGTVSVRGESQPAVTDEPTASPTKTPSKAVKVKKGTVIKDKKTKASYKVLSVKSGALAVEYLKPTSKNIKSVSIKTYITYVGKKYKIVKIADKAFMNCKKLTKVTVGKNVKTIGKKAFANCKALKTVQIPKGLKKSKIPKNAFTGCRKKPKIKVFK